MKKELFGTFHFYRGWIAQQEVWKLVFEISRKTNTTQK